MIANHPSWNAPLPPRSNERAPQPARPTGGRDAYLDSPIPTVGQAIAQRVVRSPWTIVVASLSLGVLAGCLVKRR